MQVSFYSLFILLIILYSIYDTLFNMSANIILFLSPQRGSHDSNPSPLPARAAAALAISELIPIVATTDTAMVGRILETLSGFVSTETSSGLPLSLNLGLGLTVTRLFDEHFLDIAGTQVQGSGERLVLRTANVEGRGRGAL